MRFRAITAYDGAGYYGFQRQANVAPTIQAEIEAALARISGQAVRVTGAGRTDAGVHATGQVIAFDLDWRHSAEDLRNALNATLPESIAVREVSPTGGTFHPRYDAISRTYVYRLYAAQVRDPLRRNRAWHVKADKLDLEAMQVAARALLGEHDFSTFGSPPQGENPVRNVFEARWGVGDEYCFTITANAFLYRMVRHIMSTLVRVGLARMTPVQFRDILAARDPGLVRALAPPYGLTLVAVNYADEPSGDAEAVMQQADQG
jgi:tRNA pseudouridine38-40 synthase